MTTPRSAESGRGQNDLIHEFTEDVNDYSMCRCGIPATVHDAVMNMRAADVHRTAVRSDRDAAFLASEYRHPLTTTCPHCFSLVDYEHVEAHRDWHFPVEKRVTPLGAPS